jgi:hypothetical protein
MIFYCSCCLIMYKKIKLTLRFFLKRCSFNIHILKINTKKKRFTSEASVLLHCTYILNGYEHSGQLTVNQMWCGSPQWCKVYSLSVCSFSNKLCNPGIKWLQIIKWTPSIVMCYLLFSINSVTNQNGGLKSGWFELRNIGIWKRKKRNVNCLGGWRHKLVCTLYLFPFITWIKCI